MGLLHELEHLATEKGIPLPPDDEWVLREPATLREFVDAVNAGLGAGESVETSTVHFFRALDLVSPPGRGRGAKWTRLQAREIWTVRLLQRKGLTLRAIRDGVASAGKTKAAPPAPAAPAPGTAAPLEAPGSPAVRFRRSPVEAIPLAPGVEILVRRPLAAKDDWALRHLLEEAERFFLG